MLNRLIAKSLMTIVPEKVRATVTLMPDSLSPTTVQVFNAWLKPMSVKLAAYGALNLQGDETLLKVSDSELNPAGNGREIRARDRIVVGTTTYVVLAATLKTVRTVWECVVRKEMV